jgi:hypothetical protein
LDKLYDEVKSEIKKQLIESAKEKLKQILNLDPTYPDPLGLKERLLGSASQAAFPNTPAQQPLQGSQYQQQPQYPGQPQYQQPPQSLQQPQYQGQPQYQQSPQYQPQPQYQPRSKARSGKGCLIAGLVGGGALLLIVGAIVIIGISALFKTSSPTSTGNSTEPVLGTGDVQVTLRWSAPVDLDLHVTDPAGEDIWFSNPSSSSGGVLDVDANAGCNLMMTNPVENVFWSTGGAPSGQYQVSVSYYDNCGYSSPVSFTVTIKQNNQPTQVLNGTVNNLGDTQSVTNFTR